MTDPILITGGSSGIGATVARLAAERGIPVAITYRKRQEAALALVKRLREQGKEAYAISADVSSEVDIIELFKTLDGLIAPRSLGGLVNSAGISGPHGSIANFTGTGLAELWATNITGTILASREAVQRFRRRPNGGAIVNVSSMAATIGGRPGAAAYAASKAAIDAFTVGLAKEVASHNIRVNAVRPGATDTAMLEAVTADPESLAAVGRTIPINRLATAEEVAKPILWLLSDEASFVTGARLDVSGGGFVIPGFGFDTDSSQGLD
jgi:NAD(P)-dependent dehydrogenase (short-subunit alcohol dehydrogenase family)